MRGKITVNLHTIAENLTKLKKNIPVATKIMLVVKADGYGHGAVPIAQSMQGNQDIWGFGVATVEEGMELRGSGIEYPILVLGCIFPEHYEVAIEHELGFCIFSKETAVAISNTAKKMKKTAIFHIKIDTGMTRLGFHHSDSIIEDVIEVCKLECVKIEGIFTHFSKADEADRTFSNLQHTRFLELVRELEHRGIVFENIHCSNSAGTIELPQFSHNIVRVGIALYGLQPSEDVNTGRLDLKPSLSWISHVSQVRWIDAGESISYGGIHTLEERRRIATIPIGYADGYPRSLSNIGYVLVHGERAPIVGRICMDQFMIDVTGIDDVENESEVILVGVSGNQNISVEELGGLAHKFNYEFVCGIGKRMPREYII